MAKKKKKDGSPAELSAPRKNMRELGEAVWAVLRKRYKPGDKIPFDEVHGIVRAIVPEYTEGHSKQAFWAARKKCPDLYKPTTYGNKSLVLRDPTDGVPPDEPEPAPVPTATGNGNRDSYAEVLQLRAHIGLLSAQLKQANERAILFHRQLMDTNHIIEGIGEGL